MFQFRKDSWTGRILVLGLALSMVGAGSLLHLTHHLPGDEDFNTPWECTQCKIAENSIGELMDLSPDLDPALTCEFPIPWAEFNGPNDDRFEPTSPRAPPVLT